jgi:hypothetical protein
MNERELTKTEKAIEAAYGADIDFIFLLDEKNIIVAKPTEEEARALNLKEGEFYAVSHEGVFALDREKFNAEEKALQQRWNEEEGRNYKAWDFDDYMSSNPGQSTITEARALLEERKGYDEALFHEDREAFYREMYYGEKGVGMDILIEEARKNTEAEIDGGLLVAERMREIERERRGEAESGQEPGNVADDAKEAIYSAFNADHGCDFVTELIDKNIAVATPAADEARALNLKEGELYAVTQDGKTYDLGEMWNGWRAAAFEDAEYMEQWGPQVPKTFKEFMESGPRDFFSIAEARAYITPEAVAERAAERAQFDKDYEAEKAQWEAERDAPKTERPPEAASDRHLSRMGENRRSLGRGRDGRGGGDRER